MPGARGGGPARSPAGWLAGGRRARAARLGHHVAVALPVPLVDPTDPAAGFLATLARATVPALQAAPVHSVEVRLQLDAALIEAGDPAATTELRGAVDDWRLPWHAGLSGSGGSTTATSAPRSGSPGNGWPPATAPAP